MVAINAASVVVVGRSPWISHSMAEAFDRHDIGVRYEQGIRDSAVTGDFDDVDSAILMIDGPTIQSLFDGRPSCTSRRTLREQNNAASDLAVETILAMGVRRFLAVCDTRQLSFGKRICVVRWVRDLTRRIGYECSINGPHRVAASYALADTDHDVRCIADAAVDWHRGNTCVESAGAVADAGTETARAAASGRVSGRRRRPQPTPVLIA